ncbi:MAG: hypothetical protein C4563_03990 [Desulfobulbus sp.]|nr:MAG: hypothetical protein C4563_03990 [Desulfobulbus sp.]
MQKINEIISEIKRLEAELTQEIQKKEKEFYYKISGRKVYFEDAARQYQKTLVIKLHTYLLEAPLLNILTAPIIWSCLVPAIFLDLVLSLYHAVCFPVYGIPKVRRSDYIVIDRHSLSYLNLIEKINCVYCGYFNGLIAYVQEIAARTEQYWCPIKHASKTGSLHSRYGHFFAYGDADSYREGIEKIRRDFEDIQ